MIFAVMQIVENPRWESTCHLVHDMVRDCKSGPRQGSRLGNVLREYMTTATLSTTRHPRKIFSSTKVRKTWMLVVSLSQQKTLTVTTSWWNYTMLVKNERFQHCWRRSQGATLDASMAFLCDLSTEMSSEFLFAIHRFESFWTSAWFECVLKPPDLQKQRQTLDVSRKKLKLCWFS